MPALSAEPVEGREDAVLGHGSLGAEGLGEQADPEFLEHPARLAQIAVGQPGLALPACAAQLPDRVSICLLNPLGDGHVRRVARRVLRQLVQPPLHPLQVAG